MLTKSVGGLPRPSDDQAMEGEREKREKGREGEKEGGFQPSRGLHGLLASTAGLFMASLSFHLPPSLPLSLSPPLPSRFDHPRASMSLWWPSPASLSFLLFPSLFSTLVLPINFFAVFGSGPIRFNMGAY